MQRPLIIALVLLVLLAQWGLAAHASQPHDDGGSCALCLAGGANAHALPTGTVVHQFPATNITGFSALARVSTAAALPAYQVRAPPTFNSFC